MSKETKTNFVTNFQRPTNSGCREKMWYQLLRDIMKDFQTKTSWQTMAQAMAELNNQQHRNSKPQMQKGPWVVGLSSEVTACQASRPPMKSFAVDSSSSSEFRLQEIICPFLNYQASNHLQSANAWNISILICGRAQPDWSQENIFYYVCFGFFVLFYFVWV